MSQVNFLADKFMREQTRKARASSELALIAVVVVAILGWGVMSWQEMEDLKSQIQMRQDESAAVQKQADQFARLTSQCQDLQRQAALQQELALPIDVNTVIATIGQLAPDSLTVTYMSIGSPPPKPRKGAEGTASSSEAQSKERASRAAAARRRRMRIELSGICPADRDIANFVGDLTGHQLFSSVKLLHSTSGQIRGVAVRQFKIEITAPLDRLYVPMDEAHKEVAHAD